MNPLRIAICLEILGLDGFLEGASAERIVEHGVGSSKQIFLRKRRLLRQESPWPIGHGKLGIRVPPCFRDRDHVEYGETLYLFRMVQRETVGNAAAAIGPNEGEFWRSH